MSYATIEAGLLTIVRGVDSLESAAVTRSDFSVLDAGYAECAVLEPGGMEMEPPEPTTYDGASPIRYRVWQTKINLFERIQGRREDEVMAAFIALRDAVIAEIEAYPQIGDAARMTDYVSSTADGDVLDVFNRAGEGPFYRTQVVRVRVREIVYLTGGEYA